MAETFGLLDGAVAFCRTAGSRGFGYQFGESSVQGRCKHCFALVHPFPGIDKELVYAPLGTPEANNYIDDMSLGANFATVNHMLINAWS